MAKQLMIYERAVPISSDRHRDWSVKVGDSYAFAREVNSVPLLAAEFLAAAPEHTIVFAGDGDAVFPTVILGTQDKQNAFIGTDGAWSGKYIPAFVRRYPFVFARSEDGKTFTLCIDEEFEGFNKDGRGERLFDADGKRTQYLETMLTFVREYQALFERTQLFCKRLKENNLLDPAQAQFKLPSGESRSLAGFFTINRDRLKELAPEKLAEMVRTDELELCYAHLHSLRNLQPMAERAAA
ncbi:SapC family protein [Halovulum dunhuangense]|uniref:SapC family protein n=1 Tax=Halovulum dunhuangense TaxID=1505036 RepID=A0A849L2D6_9RHOB|nr:SapC family protein [Halovulum dunhuangense]NNU80371.1 SapC family protein [Halovulum dunhuangense]